MYCPLQVSHLIKDLDRITKPSDQIVSLRYMFKNLQALSSPPRPSHASRLCLKRIDLSGSTPQLLQRLMKFGAGLPAGRLPLR